MFSAACDDPNDNFKPDDEWINNNIYMLIKDNTPMIKTSKYSSVK